jgi:hypothetical protein
MSAKAASPNAHEAKEADARIISEQAERARLINALEEDLRARIEDKKQTPLQSAADAAPPGSTQYEGMRGDYYGGIWGTWISAITALLVLGTWWWTRKSDNKSKSYQVFTEMLRTHEEIVTSMRVGDVSGRDAISLILSEFSFVYRTTTHFVPDYSVWDMRQRVEISFVYTYYGPNLHTQRVLESYDPALLKMIADAVSAKRNKTEELRGTKTPHRLFRGHQNRLSHYFRNLFSAYKFIDESDLSANERRSLGKVLRSKLSNYEQALLLLNVMSSMGRAWKDSGLLASYQPVKNIPKNFFSFDEKQFDLKTEFPEIQFEWET